MPNYTQGTARPNVKLSEKVVACARALCSQGWNSMKLARYFGVSESTMYSALVGDTWSHVPRPCSREIDRR